MATNVLNAGDSLKLLPGQALVMESWAPERHHAVYFTWNPQSTSEGVSLGRRAAPVVDRSADWRAGVLQPLLDLRLALGLAGAALARLVAGLVSSPACALLSLGPHFFTHAATARKRPQGE